MNEATTTKSPLECTDVLKSNKKSIILLTFFFICIKAELEFHHVFFESLTLLHNLPVTLTMLKCADSGAADITPNAGREDSNDDSAREVSEHDLTSSMKKGKRKHEEDVCIIKESKSLFQINSRWYFYFVCSVFINLCCHSPSQWKNVPTEMATTT